MLENILIIPLAAYGFGTAMQMLRGNYLNFKPFNCKACCSFWISFIIYPIVYHNIYIDYVIYALFVFCMANFLKLFEDKIIGTRGIL